MSWKETAARLNEKSIKDSVYTTVKCWKNTWTKH